MVNCYKLIEIKLYFYLCSCKIDLVECLFRSGLLRFLLIILNKLFVTKMSKKYSLNHDKTGEIV